MALRKDERLERPNGPEGNEDGEVARFQDDALVSREFQREVGAEQAGTGMRSRILALMEEFFRGLIRERFGGQIWQCGCGLLAPMSAPRFSKICTQDVAGAAPSSAVSWAQAPTTAQISSTERSGRVRWCFGEKQSTRQRPLSGAATSRPLSSS